MGAALPGSLDAKSQKRSRQDESVVNAKRKTLLSKDDQEADLQVRKSEKLRFVNTLNSSPRSCGLVRSALASYPTSSLPFNIETSICDGLYMLVHVLLQGTGEGDTSQDGLQGQDRKALRKAKNRASAAASRARREAYTASLEDEVILDFLLSGAGAA